jgi:DNA-binding CsgD family transcriptional regulator
MENHESLINQIYEAATVPDLWPAVLGGLCRNVNGSLGLLVTWRIDHWMGMRNSSESNSNILDSYVRSDAPLQSITHSRLFAANVPGFLSNQHLLGEREYKSDPMMTEWAGPSGLYNGAATAIQIPNGDVFVLQVMKRRGQPAFKDDALNRLNAFRPHIARALMLAARWRLERLHAAVEALTLLGLPAAILDERGKVLMANALIQVSTGYMVWGAGNRIEFTDKSATHLLKQAMRSAANPSESTVQSFPVRGRQPGDSAVAHLVPIAARSRELFEDGLSILVITPVTGPNPPDTAIIQSLFDLTPAEARVAQGLVKGLTITEMARHQGTGRETVRSQVKAVLGKTGSRRQAEVAAKLSGLGGIQIRK